VLVAKGFRVFGSVRKPTDADRLSREFGARFSPLFFDMTDEATVAAGGEKSRPRSLARRCSASSITLGSRRQDRCYT
jgi:hypothetical protein